MNLRSLTLDQFRKFDRPVRIDGLCDGINILAERNEFGKSTILAAIRGVLFERHLSRANAVRTMQNRHNQTSPVISLDFELGGGVHRIEKRFLHRECYAKLTLADGSRHEGDAAEEKLQQLLGFAQPGRNGSNEETTGMWGALWVNQRKSFEQAILHDIARNTIHSCLDSEVGALAGGVQGQRLIAAVAAELSKLIDGHGKPRNRYKQAQETLDAAQIRLADLRQKRKDLERDIQELQDAKEKLAQVTETGETQRMEGTLKEAHRNRELARLHETRLSEAKAKLNLAESNLASAVEENERRLHRQSDLAQAEKRRATAIEAERFAREQFDELDLELKHGRETVALAAAKHESLRGELREKRKIADLAARADNITLLEARLHEAEQAQAQVNALSGELASIPADEDKVREAHRLSRELQQKRSVLHAQATRVDFIIEQAAVGRLQISGQPLGNTDNKLAITADTEIVIAGVGRIVIRPAIKNREASLAQIAKAETALKQSLEEMNVSGTEEADAQLAKRQSIELRLARAKDQVSQLTPANRGQKLAAGLEALRNYLGSLQGQLKTEMSALKLAVRPELQAAQNEAQLAESAESQAAGELAIAQSPIPDLEKRQVSAFKKHSKAEAEAQAAQDEVTRLNQETVHALALESAKALADRLNTARHARTARRDDLPQLQQSQSEDEVAVIDARIKRYEHALKNRQEEAHSTAARIAVLNSRIEREGGIGLGEQIADTERSHEELLRERTAFEKEVKTLTLLRDILCQAELEAKERYMAPVIRRITPYLRRLFPNSAIECDENFQITGVTRNSETAEEFTQLSDGTQEQVAVLTRLAFADMLKDRAKPAMVILDDALVFSDTERMERMFDILTQAAARTQILILTCRGEIFARLGGNRLQVVQ